MKAERTGRISKARKIDRQKVRELAEQGMGTMDIARHQHVASSTISRYLDKLSIERQTIKRFTDHRADALATVHMKALDAQDLILDRLRMEVGNDVIWNALSGHLKIGYLNSVTVAGGVAYDKLRLETGKSTENISLLSTIIEGAHGKLFKQPIIEIDQPKESAHE